MLAPKSGVDGVRLFRRIYSELKRDRVRREAERYLTPVTPNFEELIQAVDDVVAQLTSDTLLGPFVSFKKTLSTLKPRLDQYSRYASKAREYILQQTTPHCSEGNPTEHPLVESLSTLAEVAWLRIMSLNYDDLPRWSGIRFQTGFVDRGKPYSSRVSRSPVLPKDAHELRRRA